MTSFCRKMHLKIYLYIHLYLFIVGGMCTSQWICGGQFPLLPCGAKGSNLDPQSAGLAAIPFMHQAISLAWPGRRHYCVCSLPFHCGKLQMTKHNG